MPRQQDGLRILITGASGNLGRKLLAHFLAAGWCRGLVGLSYEAIDDANLRDPKLRLVAADLSDSGDRRWRDAFVGIDAVIHLAAQNPYPDASWSDSAASVDMTLNVIDALRRVGGRRVVFASSNHVMGGYKDVGLGSAELTTDLPPRPGTRFREGDGYQDSTPYAVAKLMNERICSNWALTSGGKVAAVSVRIGWCRPGENKPEEITLEAMPGASLKATADAESARDLKWARDMWLSNRDLCALMECAVRADATALPSPAVVVNGNSANRGMPWNLDGARNWLGYAPQDNLYAGVKP